MFREIVIPRDNEEEFIQLGLKLGMKNICFLYSFDENSKVKIEKLTELNHKNIKIESGLIVNGKNVNEALQQSKFPVAKSSDQDRILIESKKIKLIYGFEEVSKKDYLHQRISGLNHTICELAKENNVTIGFPYSSLFNKNENEISMILGRFMQNIKLCQKYNVKTMIGAFSEKPYEMRAPHDVISLFILLGMDGKIVKYSFGKL